MAIQIRMIRPEDAASFLQLCHQLDQETRFMLLEPGERTQTVEQQRRQLEELQANQAIFVAVDGDRLIGYVSATGAHFRRIRHKAYLVAGILQAYTGQGIGTRLFQAVEAWARQRGLHRLELTVMTHNAAGIALYTKQGFVIEGTARHSCIVDGHYVDEYYMAKLLDEANERT
ncbi:RimJ/RimL family protein N-acetyltransferase [Thermosporothrix hazakensis]|uniref:RimJ/RimL family protein N-acetyltransferase n=2 Tax=Thermosporothrix TaxID=768650 RepID=A0A326UC82_THEHA|nr:GNAT family protein [Thermosporothrix hazakensis]PZW35936.1 RimJ/RimL family protein N-acetyltransferase [Thermosporothrix hazakensis]BBH88404.1 N-acetyltransferase [Thermosporothrix sp. COM3]GCE46591.1 N-acetyltransferase [Thermosporothrix hazakensis]